jgi:hypothetical protein
MDPSFSLKELESKVPSGWENATLALGYSVDVAKTVQRIDFVENLDGQKIILFCSEPLKVKNV